MCSSTLFSGIDKYHDQIVRSLSEGKCRSVLYRELQAIGLTCGKTAAYEYFNLVAKRYNIELTPLESCSSEQKQLRKKIQKYIYISRKKIFDYLWYDEKLDIEPQYFEYLLNRYPIIITLKICIREFRMIFEKGYQSLLYCFINKYKGSSVKLIIPHTGKHQSTGRKTSFHGKENSNPRKERSNPLKERTSCII